jgi:hypothetical protein
MTHSLNIPSERTQRNINRNNIKKIHQQNIDRELRLKNRNKMNDEIVFEVSKEINIITNNNNSNKYFLRNNK